MNQPKLIIDHEDFDKTDIPTLPSSIPSFLASTDSKSSIIKSNLRAYEADPIKLTPGLDPSHFSTSPIAEPVLTGPRVRFSSTDQIFQVILYTNFIK